MKGRGGERKQGEGKGGEGRGLGNISPKGKPGWPWFWGLADRILRIAYGRV